MQFTTRDLHVMLLSVYEFRDSQWREGLILNVDLN